MNPTIVRKYAILIGKIRRQYKYIQCTSIDFFPRYFLFYTTLTYSFFSNQYTMWENADFTASYGILIIN
jgi:hypothetical protein